MEAAAAVAKAKARGRESALATGLETSIWDALPAFATECARRGAPIIHTAGRGWAGGLRRAAGFADAGFVPSVASRAAPRMCRRRSRRWPRSWARRSARARSSARPSSPRCTASWAPPPTEAREPGGFPHRASRASLPASPFPEPHLPFPFPQTTPRRRTPPTLASPPPAPPSSPLRETSSRSSSTFSSRRRPRRAAPSPGPSSPFPR